MLVKDIMRADVVTITPSTALPAIVALMRARGVRHLPVVEDDRLVGIVSDRDVKRAMASPATSLEAHELTYLLDRIRAGELMTRAVVTVGAMFPVEHAARVMVAERISALPVTEAGRLVGIVTETDVLRLFVRALGAGEPSSRLDIDLGASRGALADVVHALEDADVPIASVMTLVDPSGRREAIVRVATIDPTPAVHAVTAKGYTIRDAWQG